MTATVSREITITYAGVTVGGTSDNLLDRFYRLRKTYESFELSFEAVVTMAVGATDAQFATACLALETAFRTPKGTLTLSFNASSHVSLADGTTAYGVVATCEKIAEDEGPDSRRSRKYLCTVSGALPADLAGKNYLRRLTWTVEWTPARQRVITIEGTYTMQSGVGSFAQYQAQIATRAAAIITAAGGGTFEIVSERATPDDDDDETNFSIVYQEVIYNQSSGTLDDDDIVRQAMTIRRTRVGPGDTPAVKRLQRIVVAYQAFLDKDSTQDLRGKWTAKIRPWLIANARTFSGSSTLALMDESPDFGPDENRITASMEFMATTGTGLLSQTITTRDERDRNKIVRKQWRQVGDADSYTPPKARVLSAPVTIRRTVTTVQEVLGDVSPPGPATPVKSGGAGFGFGFSPPGATQFLFNGGTGLGLFGIGETISLTFTPGALAGGGPGKGAANGGLPPGPQWTRVGVTSMQTTPITYGQDELAFKVTRVESTDVFELLDIDADAPRSTTGDSGNAVGGSRTVPRTT